ncbi:MAG: hypothetical protein K2X61_06160 [Caulobacteraceae bacterium]|uniref:Anti-sigma factor n=1 Tax=Brevundimonas staleyi TaxID=74326 RepID=A0ABW0FPQ4_9CAUL|nr:hypothetical protein [Brevundimonas diminuta]MBX9707499.1 hypothetical protein [Caulobacteraceae bacterium]MDM8354058.1 hypothetical protein [Brevundimonas diminuta]
MTRDLDELLARLAATPVDRPLYALESQVWTRVDALRTERLMAQLRGGAVAVALVAGLTAGGVGAVASPRVPTEMSIFTVEAGLSPLLRLDAAS